MNPIVWGPALWQALFACASAAHTTTKVAALRELLLTQIPLLLPCARCRQHFQQKRAKVTRRAQGEPNTSDQAVRWLWFLKDEVNRTQGRVSVPLDDVRKRITFHANLVDDVALADVLVLVALSAKIRDRDVLFVECCHTFAILLPLPHDSQLRHALQHMSLPVVTNALRAAKASRIERGLPPLTLPQYKTQQDDDAPSAR